MVTHELKLLGGFELTCDARPIELLRDSQRLVAFLAVNRRALPRTYVAGSLWADASQQRADGNLRSALWRIRKASRSLVRTDDQTIELSETAVDVVELSRTARRLCSSRGRACDDLPVDLAALSQRLLPDWTDEWLLVERERHRQESLHALEAVAERLADRGRCDEAIQAALRAVQLDPLRESAHRCLVRIHLREGNRSEAVRHASRFRSLLGSRLGLTPSRHLTDLVDLT